MTLQATDSGDASVTAEIKSLCNTIHNSTMFAENSQLLVGALAALQAAKGVLDSRASVANTIGVPTYQAIQMGDLN